MFEQDREPWLRQAVSFDGRKLYHEWMRVRLAKQNFDVPRGTDVIRVRTIFLSDVHLGTAACQAALLHDFLCAYDADVIYLVGDIIDGWQLRSRWYWPETHNDVVQVLLRKVRGGAQVTYIPGNHDEFLRASVGSTFAGIEIREHAMHSGVDGRHYLVIHGDQFDWALRHARWLALLGDWGYQATIALNAYLNLARRRLGLNYWSLSAWAKLNIKNVVSYISRFEELLSAEAKRHGAQGVICGHIHHATLRDDLAVRYINTGDWVESCTAVVEYYDGRFEIVRWANGVCEQAVDLDVLRRRYREYPRGRSQAAPL